MSRLTPPTLAGFDEDQKKLFDRLAGDRGAQGAAMGGPFDVWLTSAEMARRVIGLGNFFRFRTSVQRRYVELVILVTGAFWRAQFEWFAHEPMAREAGLPEDVIQAIKRGDSPQSDDPADRAAYALAHELHTTHQVADDTFAAAVAQFGERGVAELVNLAGYYTMVSMTLNTFDVDLPDGAEKPFS